MNVLEALVKLVPIVIRIWVHREIDVDGGKYTIPCFLVFLHWAGWILEHSLG